MYFVYEEIQGKCNSVNSGTVRKQQKYRSDNYDCTVAGGVMDRAVAIRTNGWEFNLTRFKPT